MAPRHPHKFSSRRRSTTTQFVLAFFGAITGLALLAPASLADANIDRLGAAGKIPQAVGLNSAWVVIAGCFVMFMQGGLAMVEVGFVRGKNAGSIIPKFLVNFAICAAAFWAVGFAVSFGDGNLFTGTSGWFLSSANDFALAWPQYKNGVTAEALWWFQFTFCAIALAIVWGTTLERIKFSIYIVYAIIFSAVIYPLVAHWIFSDGWLRTNFHVQDFAGSIVVDVTAAAAALAVLVVLGPRRGKYGGDGKPRAIPGHNMPLFGLGIFILWLGWYGFNPGSTLTALDGRFPEIVIITTLAGAFGVLAAVSLMAGRGEKTPLTMTMMGGPIDARKSPTAVNNLAMNKSYEWFENNVIYRVPSNFPGAGRRVYPGFLQHTGFVAMNPDHHAKSHYDYFKDLIKGDDVSTEAHRKFYDEYNAVLDMDADYYLETIKVVFQDFSLVNGTWDVKSPSGKIERVRPSAITSTALMSVEGELDDISGSGQTRAVHEICTGVVRGQQRHFEAKGAGHYGIFSGRRWRELVYPEVRSFILSHQAVTPKAPVAAVFAKAAPAPKTAVKAVAKPAVKRSTPVATTAKAVAAKSAAVKAPAAPKAAAKKAARAK
jgi:hypothetical protein